MNAKHTISINGQVYDAVTGLRVTHEPAAPKAAAPTPVQPVQRDIQDSPTATQHPQETEALTKAIDDAGGEISKLDLGRAFTQSGLKSPGGDFKKFVQNLVQDGVLVPTPTGYKKRAQNEWDNPYDNYDDKPEEPEDEPELTQVGEGKYASADGLMAFTFAYRGPTPAKQHVQAHIDSVSPGYVVVASRADETRQLVSTLIRQAPVRAYTTEEKRRAIHQIVASEWGLPQDKGNNPGGMGADYDGTILNREGQDMTIPQGVPSADADNSGGEKNVTSQVNSGQPKASKCKYCGSDNTSLFYSYDDVDGKGHCNDCSMQWTEENAGPRGKRQGKKMTQPKKQAARIHEGWGDQNEYKRELEADSAEDVWKLHQSLNGQEVQWGQKIPSAVAPQEPDVAPNGDVSMPEKEPTDLTAQDMAPAPGQPQPAPMPVQAKKVAQSIDSDFPDGQDDPELKKEAAYKGWALLPTGTYMNPKNPEGATYYDKGQSMIICSREGASKPVVLTTFGDGQGYSIGQRAIGFHDQSRGQILYGEVIGIRRSDGTEEGNVPNRSLPHWVFK
jgi:hypothetical protein